MGVQPQEGHTSRGEAHRGHPVTQEDVERGHAQMMGPRYGGPDDLRTHR